MRFGDESLLSHREREGILAKSGLKAFWDSNYDSKVLNVINLVTMVNKIKQRRDQLW